ncbi:hypothetical protein TNCV_4381101 [Trichonephila clavipes]|nr:hypothetical protein TNCV_4381101 [Trichonephila clavipes]
MSLLVVPTVLIGKDVSDQVGVRECVRKFKSSNRLVFHSTGTSRTPDSQTPGSRTAVHILMGEKRKKCLERRNLAEKHDSSLFLWNPVLFESCRGSAYPRP